MPKKKLETVVSSSKGGAGTLGPLPPPPRERVGMFPKVFALTKLRLLEGDSKQPPRFMKHRWEGRGREMGQYICEVRTMLKKAFLMCTETLPHKKD